MKTVETHLTDQPNTNLFRNLFQLRIELENHADERFVNFGNEVTHIIERIDDLLQLVLDDPSS